MSNVIYLGKEVLGTNELLEKSKSIVFSNSSFFCTIKSVKYTEFYQAMKTGLKPENVIVMNKYEYRDYMQNAKKRFCRVVDNWTLESIDYTIIREYETNNDLVELTISRGIETYANA